MSLQREELDEVKYLPWTAVEKAYDVKDPTFVVADNCEHEYKRFFNHLRMLATGK